MEEEIEERSMKTPEELAKDWVIKLHPEGADAGTFQAHVKTFLAGYQAALDSEKPGGWVSVKDKNRLPNEDEPVLVYGQGLSDIARVLGVRRRYRGDQDWKYTWESEGEYIFTQDDVTHWMPLPDPPKEEK